MTVKCPLVVVVDDAAAVRSFFVRAAAQLPVNLLVFASAADAMPLLAEQRPDLLFLDIIMPDKDGLTFLQELRTTSLHHDTAVIIISSKDYAQDRQTATDLGVKEFVPKPMTAQVVREKIAQYAGLPPRNAA
ncbi:MAG: response regulator [Gammaproteobacteria bacterium]|nr:response regulator [Gammaproteobacteria bacterium]